MSVAGPRERALTPAVGDRTGAEGLHRFFDELRTSWRRNPHQMRALYVLMFDAVLPAPFLRDRMAASIATCAAGLRAGSRRGRPVSMRPRPRC
ncbi:hypothetical protein [Streptomyces noursei]|uniref:hypothetical protein n=1 Tax=Streptomyces noursei TaxID=1971 RepID=UPI001962BFC1|nr:hypothetical protein [Streptomyces noursei]QRX94090.1 hypothetical protein JNO44_27525 [Streptomyces noursei]